jgi:hypothetical protein
LTSVYTGNGRVLWVTFKGAAMRTTVAVLDASPSVNAWPGELLSDFDCRTKTNQEPKLRVLVQTNESSKYFSLAPHSFAAPQTFLLDNASRLWMGVDKGEWGGEYGYINLQTGAVHWFEMGEGILGLIRTSDDRLLAYGGMVHMAYTGGFVAEITPKGSLLLKNFNNDFGVIGKSSKKKEQEQPKQGINPSGPYPVGIAVEDVHGHGFFVLVGHTVYHVNREFTDWDGGDRRRGQTAGTDGP